MGDIRKILIVLIVFFAPFFAKGSVVINEIMYNLDGADKGREWVEIFNSGSAPIDLSGWKFFENKTNHKIKLAGGEENFIIPVGGYAVLADRPKKFLSDWPNFSGTIFDTAFSLKNSGEPLALRDSGLNDVDSVFYNSDWGGDGDGSSLQKIGGKWVGARPTPGALNSGQQNQTQEKKPVHNEQVSEIDPEPPKKENVPPSQTVNLPVESTAPEAANKASKTPKQDVLHSAANTNEAVANIAKTDIQPKIQKPKPRSLKVARHSVHNNSKKSLTREKSATVADSPQTASAVIAVGPNRVWGVEKWLLAVLGLGIFGGIGFIFIRRQNLL